MKNQFKLAIIGGTGKSGKYLVKELVNQGFHFKMLVRNPEHMETASPLIEVVQGNVLDYETLQKLTEGCDAIISTLGLGIPPSAPDIFSKASTNVLRSMESNGIKRYILTTGLNVDAPSDHKSGQTATGTAWMKANYPISTADKQLEYEILANSNLDWTMVRLPLIEQSDTRSEISVNLQDCPGENISAANLAAFLISQLTDETYLRKAPFISNK